MSINSIHKIPALYHFTDVRNLPLIRKLGGLYPLSQIKTLGEKVPAPGGNEWSQDADSLKGLGEYVHLCFKSNHPMEYLARQDGRIGNSIFLEIHPAVLKLEGVKFTPDVSNKAGVNAHPIDDADRMMDFEVLYTRTDWSDAAIQERLQKAEKYEVLVPSLIPLKHIRNLPDG